MPAADGGRECRQCREDARAQPRAATLCYKYLGHDPLDVTRELSTWFHASWAPTRDCRGRLLDFPETFSVFDFLQWEYRVLPFDNQLHVTHWNLVHLSPFRFPGDPHPVFKVFDHRLLMNQIPPHVARGLQIHVARGLQIHAASLRANARWYLPGLVSPENTDYLTTRLGPATLLEGGPAREPPSNDGYYARQTGGHGLFHAAGAVYGEHGAFEGLAFSAFSQANPFALPAAGI